MLLVRSLIDVLKYLHDGLYCELQFKKKSNYYQYILLRTIYRQVQGKMMNIKNR